MTEIVYFKSPLSEVTQAVSRTFFEQYAKAQGWIEVKAEKIQNKETKKQSSGCGCGG